MQFDDYGNPKSLVQWFHDPLSTIFGHTPQPELVMGLEFENELPFPCDMPKCAGWTMHHENSLRDFGYEYVSTKPVRDGILRKQVVTLFKKIEETCAQMVKQEGGKYKPSNSIRTSVHIHLDATSLTYLQVLNFALVYWLLEDFLSAYCGQSRQGNLFCLRLKDASYQKYCLLSELQNKAPYSTGIFNDTIRYASLNLAAIRKFGSLESRLMRGTTNTQEVFVWMDAMLAIYKYALSGVPAENGKFVTPKDIQKDFLLGCNAPDYPARVLGLPLFEKMNNMCKLPQSYPQIAAGVRSNYINLVDLFNASDTFDFFKDAEEQNKKIAEGAIKLAKKVSGLNAVWGDPVNILATAGGPAPTPSTPVSENWTPDLTIYGNEAELGDL